MADLTDSDVEHIATLARLTLSKDERQRMARELSAILKYVDMLKEVNTDSVEPTAQVTGKATALREDEIRPLLASPDELLACSPLAIIDHQIRAPHAHG